MRSFFTDIGWEISGAKVSTSLVKLSVAYSGPPKSFMVEQFVLIAKGFQLSTKFGKCLKCLKSEYYKWWKIKTEKLKFCSPQILLRTNVNDLEHLTL